MTAFQSFSGLPSLWLFTDARNADHLDQAIAALPPGSGVVFRHYHLAEAERQKCFTRLMQRHAGKRRIWLWSGHCRMAQRLHADGHYGLAAGPRSQRHGLWLAPAHNMAELAMAKRQGADAVFLSPVFATRSHPDAAALGPMRFATLARHAALPVYALGGIAPGNIRRIAQFCDGWGAIDGLSDN